MPDINPGKAIPNTSVSGMKQPPKVTEDYTYYYFGEGFATIQGYEVGFFALQEQYIFRLNNFDECKLIDIFNFEFCEMPPLTLDAKETELLNGIACFPF
jgi:hypothetical protein